MKSILCKNVFYTKRQFPLLSSDVDAKWNDLKRSDVICNASSTYIFELPPYSAYPTPTVKWTADKVLVTSYEHALRHFVSEISFRLVLLDIQTKQDKLIYQATLRSTYSQTVFNTSYYSLKVTGEKAVSVLFVSCLDIICRDRRGES